MKKYIAFIGIILLLSSCEKEFDPKLPPYKPKIVVTDLFEQGKPFSFKVSHSVDIFDGTHNPDYNNDATVKLYADNVLAEVVANSGSLGVYDAGTVPVPGKTYKVVVSVPGFDDAEAESTLPVPVKINSWSYKDSTLMKLNDQGFERWYGTLKFTIFDPPGENNYLFSLKFYDQTTSSYIYISTIESGDEALNENFAKRMSNGEFMFKDTPFNGRTKTFEVLVPSGLTTTPDYLLSFYTLSHDAYLFLYSEPEDPTTYDADIYKNVKNGLGIFAGMSLDADTIK